MRVVTGYVRVLIAYVFRKHMQPGNDISIKCLKLWLVKNDALFRMMPNHEENYVIRTDSQKRIQMSKSEEQD